MRTYDATADNFESSGIKSRTVSDDDDRGIKSRPVSDDDDHVLAV